MVYRSNINSNLWEYAGEYRSQAFREGNIGNTVFDASKPIILCTVRLTDFTVCRIPSGVGMTRIKEYDKS